MDEPGFSSEASRGGDAELEDDDVSKDSFLVVSRLLAPLLR